MKKILLLTTVFAISVAAATVNRVEFNSPDNFFTMMYPDSWELTKNGTSEFIFKEADANLGKFVAKQQPTSDLASDYKTHEANLLRKFMGAKVKKFGYQDFVEYEERVTVDGKSAVRYYWITGNDKYTVTLYYEILFMLRTKEEVLNEEKQVFKTVESLKINE